MRQHSSRTYLDWNATAPLRPAARDAMIAALHVVGNPSSVHAEGRAAREIVETAREQVAALVGARPADVVFTSGATEANVTVLAAPWDIVYVAGIEHDSVITSARHASAPRRVVDLPVDRNGRVNSAAATDHVVRTDPSEGPGLVTLQLANNETGVLQDVAALAAVARANRLASHTDAVQAAGRIVLDMAILGVDFLTLSAHKLGGPKGVGALIMRRDTKLVPLIAGGGQERRRRAGTENVAAIAGFGAAAAAAIDDIAGTDVVRRRRDGLESEMIKRFPAVSVIGAESPRLPNTSCLAMAGKSAETLVIRYDLAGVALSAGAACSSGKVGASPVLAAMGLPDDVARSAIRVSLGPTTTDDDIAAFLAASTNILGAPAMAA